MNNVNIIGNLTKDPRLDRPKSGKTVCSFTVAVSNEMKGMPPEYFRVSVWDRNAEDCAKYLAQGSSVGVTGQVHLNKYMMNGKETASLAINAIKVQFLKDSQIDYDPNDPDYNDPDA